MKRELKRPVTVEDLLGLKRAERPSSDFWSEFDRRLRDKQLSALVAPRPWWRSSGWLECWHVLRRFQFPLGTSAVLALTFVAWHYDRPSVSDSHALVSPVLPFQTAEPDQLLVSPVSPVASNRQVEGAGLRIDPSEARVRSSDPEAMTPGPSAMVAEASAAGMPYAVPLLGVPVRESQESATMSSLRL